jgi:hypothetical protein
MYEKFVQPFYTIEEQTKGNIGIALIGIFICIELKQKSTV